MLHCPVLYKGSQSVASILRGHGMLGLCGGVGLFTNLNIFQLLMFSLCLLYLQKMQKGKNIVIKLLVLHCCLSAAVSSLHVLIASPPTVAVDFTMTIKLET